jgi:hypothetical membrane protein
MKKITIFLLLQYFITVSLLIILYQGGYLYAPETDHFIMNKNYLSDLGRVKYFNNYENPFWIYYSFTLSLVGIATILFFKLVSRLQKKRQFISVIFGLISGLSYIGIAVFPVDKQFDLHIISGKIAYFSFFFAVLNVNFFIDKNKHKIIHNLLLVLNVFLFLFLLLILFGPSSKEGLWALQLKTIAQKIMVSMQLLLSILILLVYRSNNDQ